VTPGAPADETVRALVAEVLARAEYARFRTFEAESFQEILRWLARFLEMLDSLSTTNPVLHAVLLVGLLLLAALLLAHIVWSVRVALAATAPLPPAQSAPSGPDLAAEAAALAGAEHFLDAAHTLQLACLGEMLAGGALELARHEPNRTLRTRLAKARLPEAERREFETLLGRLEARWFRDRAADPGDRDLFTAWRDLHRRIRAAAVRV
jgi:hypothetical protein